MFPKAPKHGRIKEKYNPRPNAAQKRYWDFAAKIGCLVCGKAPEIHHVTTDGYKRQTKNHWHVTPLCREHHRGDTGIHKLGHKRFILKHGINLHETAPVILDLYKRKDQ